MGETMDISAQKERDRAAVASAKKSPCRSVTKSVPALSLQPALKTPTKSLCSALGNDDTPSKVMNRMQPMGQGPPRFGPMGGMPSPQFGKNGSQVENPALSAVSRKSTLNQRVIQSKATGNPPLSTPRKNAEGEGANTNTGKVQTETSAKRIERFRTLARRTPVKIKSVKKLTQPVPLPLSSFRKDGYWENRKKVKEQREKARRDKEEYAQLLM